MSDIVDDERDEGLLLAWSAVAMGAGRPSDGNRLAIMSAARARAHGIANKGRKRGRWPLLALGAIVLAAYAASRWLGTQPLAVDAAAPPAGERATTDAQPAAPSAPDPGPRSLAHAPARPGGSASRTLPVLLPPAPDPFDDIAMAEARRITDPLLNTSDDRTWVLGLLFDHSLKLLRATDPLPVKPPPAGKPDPDFGHVFENLAAKALGLQSTDSDRMMATMINDPTSGSDVAPGHPRIFVWAYALRDGAELGAEAVVRSAVLGHYSGTLPVHPAGGNVALLTVVMSGDGRIEQFEQSFRPVIGSTLTASAFDADRAERFAALGLPEARFGRNGSMMIGSDSLPNGKPGGLVIADYAWPKDAGAPGDARNVATQPAVKVPGGIDNAAAVALLDARFTRAQLGDDGDGQMPWLLLDARGHLLRSGRLPGGDQQRPLELQMREAFPTLRFGGSMFTSVQDPATPGRRIDAAFFWLTADSPPPP